MHTSPLSRSPYLAAALQDWERYSAQALAAREVAATLAQGASYQLHVLSVYGIRLSRYIGEISYARSVSPL